MKLLTLTSLLLSLNTFAIDYKCMDQAIKEIVSFDNSYSGENMTTTEFLKHYDLIFVCKSKSAPHREIFQYGDGSSLMGVEYKIVRGKCVQEEDVYAGQDDQDLDAEWANKYCQEDYSDWL